MSSIKIKRLNWVVVLQPTVDSIGGEEGAELNAAISGSLASILVGAMYTPAPTRKEVA